MLTKKKIGLSFSGGGARAVAHIGIIKALRENGIEADHVAGTSGGAVVGALYAAGISVEEMMDFAAQGKLSRLFQAKLPTRGLTSLDFLENLLDQYITADTFEALDIPLTVMTSNLNTGRATPISSGPLYTAVMASCAIPLMFKPIEIENELYADGGIFDNMPVSPLLDKCDILIGANLMPIVPMEREKLNSVFSISMRTFDMVVAHNSQINFPLCDIVIEPTKAHNYGIFNFSATKELFDIGYEEAMSKMEQLKNLIIS